MEVNFITISIYLILLTISVIFIFSSLKLYKLTIIIKGVILGLISGFVIGGIINNFRDITVPIISMFITAVLFGIIAYPLHKLIIYLFAGILGLIFGAILCLVFKMPSWLQIIILINLCATFVYLTYKIYPYWIIVLLSGTPIFLMLVANSILTGFNIPEFISKNNWGRIIVDVNMLNTYLSNHTLDIISILIGVPFLSLTIQKGLFLKNNLKAHLKVYTQLSYVLVIMVSLTSFFYINKSFTNSYFLNYSLSNMGLFIIYLIICSRIVYYILTKKKIKFWTPILFAYTISLIVIPLFYEPYYLIKWMYIWEFNIFRYTFYPWVDIFPNIDSRGYYPPYFFSLKPLFHFIFYPFLFYFIFKKLQFHNK